MSWQIRKFRMRYAVQIALLVVLSWLAVASAHAQTLEYCHVNSSGVETSCHDSLAAAEQALRQGSIYGNLLQPLSVSATGASPGSFGLTIAYFVENQPAAILYDPAYLVAGWGYNAIPGFCAPSGTYGHEDWCDSEEEPVENFYANMVAQYPTCEFSPYKLVNEFTLFTHVAGWFINYGPPETRWLQYTVFCPGWEAPDLRQIQVSKDQVFSCGQGFHGRYGYNPQYNTSGNPDYVIEDWPRICAPTGPYPYIRVKAIPSRQCPQGNPCIPATGAKVQYETDFSQGELAFKRSYTSLHAAIGNSYLGSAWTHGYSDRIVPGPGTTPPYVLHIDDGGNVERYDPAGGGVFRSVNDPGSVLERGQDNHWRLRTPVGKTLEFTPSGNLSRIERTGAPDSAITIERAASRETFPDGTTVPKDAIASITDAHGRSLLFFYGDNTPPECQGATSPVPAGCTFERLVRLVLPDGGEIQYTYDLAGRLARVVHPDDSAREYHYNESQHLCPQAPQNEPPLPGACPSGSAPPIGGFPHALTGISDIVDINNPQPERYATYQYDHLGRAILSEHTGGVDRLTLEYPSATQATLRFARGGGVLRRTIDFSLQSGVFRKESGYVEADDANASVVLRESETDFDSQVEGRIATRTDANGTTTRYEYSANTLHRSAVIEAEGEPELRRIETDWDSAINRITETRTKNAAGTVVALERTAYNTRGQVTARCTIDPASPNASYVCGSSSNAPAGVRQTRYTYCDTVNPGAGCPLIGLLREIDGPRTDVSDVTAYDYRTADAFGCSVNPTTCAYRAGDLWKTTNALGHVTEIVAYDGAGRVLESKDANAVVTQLTYTPRGWLHTRTVKGATTGEDAVTTFAYTATGEVARITQPDGNWLDYDYDAAHRLIAIEDAQGNRLEYALDAAGNRTAEVTKDASATITRQLSRTYDLLNRLAEQRDAQNRPTGFGYDANGNQTDLTDALGYETSQEYDPLNRLKQTIQDVGGLDVTTAFAYDPLDRLIEVTDPKGLDTSYTYDGLGHLTELDSPDTGVTAYTYDAAGNRLSRTDARNVSASYGYDALSRLTSIAYPDSALDTAFHYDEANATTGCVTSFPQGRLTRMVDASGATAYCYDRRGNVVQKRLTADGTTRTVGYAYTKGDRLASITYPDGTRIGYGRNTLGQIVTVGKTNKPLQSIVTGTAYLPFGPLTQIDFTGNGQQSWGYDLNYWTTGFEAEPIAIPLSTDARGNVASAADYSGIVPKTYSYAYDPLSRLLNGSSGSSSMSGPMTQSSGAPGSAFTYDATGNRLSKTGGGSTQIYSYPTDSHRLAAIDSEARTYDAMGNLTVKGSETFVYGDDQRLKQFKLNNTLEAEYVHNGKGERARKTLTNAATQTDFIYDEQGKLLAEYRKVGTNPATLHRLYVWLDDRPVAVKASEYPSDWLYLHTDHLGTPRAVLQSSTNYPIWHWSFLGSIFGEHAPNEDYDDDQQPFVFNLRYPGQYYDEESGLHYNYFRDYEVGTGRYVQSDPIGLGGGANTYGYVLQNPLIHSDSTGLFLDTTREYVKACVKPAVSVGLRVLSGVGMLMTPTDTSACDVIDPPPEAECPNAGNSCPPCTPYPKGTIGYIGPHTDHDHFPIGRPHLNLFQVNQNTKNCKCFWNKATPDAAAPPPQFGWVDLNSGFPPLSP